MSIFVRAGQLVLVTITLGRLVPPHKSGVRGDKCALCPLPYA